MRIILAAALLASLGSGTMAAEQKGSGAPAASVRSTSSAISTSRDNDKARQAEIQRQKRWDERMRRATNSMCDRC